MTRIRPVRLAVESRCALTMAVRSAFVSQHGAAGYSPAQRDAGKDMGREVREYFVPDFSEWKDHDAYRVAFDRLLRDLKAEEPQR